MGINYLTPEQIKNNQSSIKDCLSDKPTCFVRDDTATSLLMKYMPNQLAKILEIGCGGGQLYRKVFKLNYQNINLVDIDNYLPEDLAKTAQINLLDVCFNRLPFADNSFDAIFALAILEHLENPFFAVREVTRVLKPKGKFFMSIPHIHSLRSKWQFFRYGDVFGYTETNNHISLFTKAVFKKIFFNKFNTVETYIAEGYIKIFGRKIRFSKRNKILNALFGNKILFVFEKK